MKYKKFEDLLYGWNGKVCLYGTGLIGKTWAYDLICAAHGKPDYYCDKKYVKGIIIRNIPLISLEELYLMKDSVMVCLSLREEFHDEVYNNLIQNGVNNIIKMGDVFFQEFMNSLQNCNDNEVLEKYCDIWDDRKYLEKRYETIIGSRLDLDEPKTFNEKLQWLKLYDRRPEYTQMVDKYTVKKYVAEKIGEQYIIPTLGVWDNFDDIDFTGLPEQFVLKCTHDSGGIVICKDRSSFSIDAAKRKLVASLKRNYYYWGREWPYKNVNPRIIAEPYIGDDLIDYKIMCFGGKVKYSFICSDRNSERGLHVTFFDERWNLMDFERHYPRCKEGFPKPRNYELMVQLAENLSESIPFIRVDFYNIDGKILFGELTFYPGSGFEEFSPIDWDEKLGRLIKLPVDQ